MPPLFPIKPLDRLEMTARIVAEKGGVSPAEIRFEERLLPGSLVIKSFTYRPKKEGTERIQIDVSTKTSKGTAVETFNVTNCSHQVKFQKAVINEYPSPNAIKKTIWDYALNADIRQDDAGKLGGSGEAQFFEDTVAFNIPGCVQDHPQQYNVEIEVGGNIDEDGNLMVDLSSPGITLPGYKIKCSNGSGTSPRSLSDPTGSYRG